MSDQENSPAPPWGSASSQTEESASETKLRVGGLPFNVAFTVGYGEDAITVTRAGTNVPSDRVQEILDAARDSEVVVEVVTE